MKDAQEDHESFERGKALYQAGESARAFKEGGHFQQLDLEAFKSLHEQLEKIYEAVTPALKCGLFYDIYPIIDEMYKKVKPKGQVTGDVQMDIIVQAVATLPADW